jgi:hypothetical protein
MITTSLLLIIYTYIYTYILYLSTSVKKKDAIVLAIKTFLNVRRREKLAGLIGNYDFGYSLKELEEMRKDGLGYYRYLSLDRLLPA